MIYFWIAKGTVYFTGCVLGEEMDERVIYEIVWVIFQITLSFSLILRTYRT